MHEIGHNLDLHHSGEAGFTGTTGEYGDQTCIMGFGDGQDDTAKCFNAAKMSELGWYTNRVVSINPTVDTFNGKVIGVADYGISDTAHTLVVEIVNPVAVEDNIYLTYNRAKGINAGTGEKKDMVTIVRGSVGGFSTLFGSLNAAAGTNSLTIEDFFNGRDLYIFVDNTGSDGDVDYATVRVELQIETCSAASDCSTGTRDCVTATCNNSLCVYNTVSGCCGNGICEPEFGETCGTCSVDCKKPDHCNDLGYFDLDKFCPKVRGCCDYPDSFS